MFRFLVPLPAVTARQEVVLLKSISTLTELELDTLEFAESDKSLQGLAPCPYITLQNFSLSIFWLINTQLTTIPDGCFSTETLTKLLTASKFEN